MPDTTNKQPPPPPMCGATGASQTVEHSVRLELDDAGAGLLLSLCKTTFPDFQDDYLLGRLPVLQDPVLHLAEWEGAPVGFKFGYRRDRETLYSWLGGVVPTSRRAGVARTLMQRQHAYAAATGYRFVETRARAANNPMIILNLRHGFCVCGFEIDERGLPMVLQRKTLA
jgi:GNAT superfamily N-acetyltransferase